MLGKRAYLVHAEHAYFSYIKAILTMLLHLLKSKIHRATVTCADLNYQGSISIDPELCRLADITPWERVDIYDAAATRSIVPSFFKPPIFAQTISSANSPFRFLST